MEHKDAKDPSSRLKVFKRVERKGTKRELPHDDLDLFFEIGVPKRQQKATKATKCQQVDPGTAKIEQYDTELSMVKEFYRKYVDELVQPFNALRCRFPGCPKPDDKRDEFRVRAHYLTHFKGDEFIKFWCGRCKNNFSAYRSLKLHKCLIRTDFPKQQHFFNEFLKEHPEHDVNSKACSKPNCNKTFKSPFECLAHLLSCYRVPYTCTKCDTPYATYNAAKIHYEGCDGTATKTSRLFFQSDVVKAPTAEDDKEWTESEMMTIIRTRTISQLQHLFDRFPAGALGYVGMTKDPITRFTKHSTCLCYTGIPARPKPFIYQKNEASPVVDNDELILFRCWSRSQALLFEYLVQHHTTQRDGEFYGNFAHRMNVMKPRRPKLMPSTDKLSHYVYFLTSRKPFREGMRDEAPPEPSEPQPSTSKGMPSTSRKIRPIVIDESSESDDDLPLSTLKKASEVIVVDSSEDEPLKSADTRAIKQQQVESDDSDDSGPTTAAQRHKVIIESDDDELPPIEHQQASEKEEDDEEFWKNFQYGQDIMPSEEYFEEIWNQNN